MPIFSYLANPASGAAQELRTALAALPHCEASSRVGRADHLNTEPPLGGS